MSDRLQRAFLFHAFAGLVAAWAFDAQAASPKKLLEPLPIEAVLAQRSYPNRSTVDLSPDGEWIAHTIMNDAEALPRATMLYSASGVSFADGDGRMDACLTHTKTDEVIRLAGGIGEQRSSSWAPMWSPDGRRVAFYSDADGEAGLWIWERSTREAQRFPGVIVRPFVEVPRWASDSRRLIVKILPERVTVAQANAMMPVFTEAPRFAAVGPDEPSVFVLRAAAEAQEKPVAKTGEAPSNGVPADSPPGIVDEGREYLRASDLALLDVETQEVKRFAPRSGASAWSFSPDERQVAYTTHAGSERDTQQSVYDLVVYDFASGESRVVAMGLRSHTGTQFNWSPDGRSLAYLTTGQRAAGEVFVVSLSGGGPRKLGDDRTPGFKGSTYRRPDWPPYWDAHGKNLFAVQGESLWRLEVASGRAVEVARQTGYQLRAIVARAGAGSFWSPDGGRSLVVSAASSAADRAGFYQIDLQTGESRPVVEDMKAYSAGASVDIDEAKGEFTFVTQDMQRPPDIWLANVGKRTARRITRLNEQFDRYELGRAQRVEWLSVQGEKLDGTLLLPAGYQKGRRYPLIVWVYGGRDGAELLNRFGIGGDVPTFNFHVLATRGYAVFSPDAPQRPGTPMKDLADSVLPGVNRVIELGIADPERLAVMGQSYGSYCTLALIAQTDRFKAAIITAVLDPDLFSSYLRMYPDGRAGSTGYFEHGQGNMGGTPWQYRDRYLDNSPLFFFDRIETPVLIGQGERDAATPPHGADSVFVALRRLGKAVEYRLYEGEEHVITRKANVIDFWKRRLEFLAEHLELALDEQGGIVFDGDHARAPVRTAR